MEKRSRTVARRAYHKKWKKDNSDKVRKHNLKWLSAHPGYQLSYRLEKKYGITYERYEHMLKTQNGKCAICDNVMDNTSKCCVDHSHYTGSIRGLLCNNCNTMLGFAKDNTETLAKAISYLARWGSKTS
jgi:hypothetical protein